MNTNQVIKMFGDNAAPMDPRVESYGILSEHAVKIARHCYSSRYMLILRACSADSVAYRRRNPCGWDSTIAPKPVFEKEKTKGGLTSNGFYSDYDILSFWKHSSNGFERLITGNKEPHETKRTVKPRSAAKHAARYLVDMPIALISLIHAVGIAEFQHGANDEYVDEQGRIKNQLVNEKFVVFDHQGLVHLVADTGAMKRFYSQYNLEWKYK